MTKSKPKRKQGRTGNRQEGKKTKMIHKTQAEETSIVPVPVYLFAMFLFIPFHFTAGKGTIHTESVLLIILTFVLFSCFQCPSPRGQDRGSNRLESFLDFRLELKGEEGQARYEAQHYA